MGAIKNDYLFALSPVDNLKQQMECPQFTFLNQELHPERLGLLEAANLQNIPF